MKTFNKIALAIALAFLPASIYPNTYLASFESVPNFCEVGQENPLSNVYVAYLAVKDALVKSDGKAAAQNASALHKAILAVSVNALESDSRSSWLNVVEALKLDSEHISETTDVKHQRDHFAALSINIYSVATTFGVGDTLFYQKCPMANGGKGAFWLSKDKAIKNPYYGSKMLSCGNTVDTLK